MEHESLYQSVADTTAHGPDMSADVPTTLDVLPDGRETVVIGEVHNLEKLNHHQGDNPYGFKSDCGLVSSEDVLRQFGVHVNEADVVAHAIANHECNVADDPAKSGGTTSDSQVQILNDYGIPAHAEQGRSLADLAADVEHGSGVIIGANAGYLWHDPQYFEHGQSNHAVVVTGVARELRTGEIQGFYLNDSGTGEPGKFVDAATMTNAWVNTGGAEVVTDVVHSGAVAGPGGQ